MVERDPLVVELKRRLQERLGSNFKGLILFGSRARGDAAGDSDYDFLVLVGEVLDDVWYELGAIGGDLLLEYGVVASLLPVEEARFERDTYEPLFAVVRKEGVRL